MSDPGRNLAVRVATAAALLPAAIWLAWLGGLAFALLCAAAAAAGAAELVIMFQKRLGLVEAAGAALAGAFPLAAWLSWRHGGGHPDWATLVLAVAVVLLLSAALFRPASPEDATRAAAVVALAWLYCGVLVSTVVALRLRFGFAWVMLVFAVTWANDTLAYLAGSRLGRRKLLPRISPHKTWEGFLGGAAGSFLGALAVRWLLLGSLPAWAALAIAGGAALLGPAGDLAESMLKRGAGVKDSGWVLPGHGGLLDRIDALLFVAPWTYACALLLGLLGFRVAAP